MGIPFGCSSVLVMILAALAWQHPPTFLSLLTAGAGVAGAVLALAGVLIGSEWVRERRQKFVPPAR